MCKRCHLVMTDTEPMTSGGDFYHGARKHQTRAMKCRNEGSSFDIDSSEIVPFMPKSRRHALKRMNIRA